MTLTPDLLLELVKAGATVEIGADGSFVVIGSNSDKQSRGNAARCSRYRQRKKEACQTMSDHVETCQDHVSDTLPLPLPPSLPLPPQTPPSPTHPPAPALARTRARPDPGRASQPELEAYAVELGLPASDGAAMFDHWTANGWRNGRVVSKCWKAGMRNWQRNGWMPSQKSNGFKTKPKHTAFQQSDTTAGKTIEQQLNF